MNSRPMLLYPSLIVAAISVTLLSLTGIAALTGHLPSAIATPGTAGGAQRAEIEAVPIPAGSEVAASRAGIEAATSRTGIAAAPNGAQTVTPACVACGVVQSVRTMERKGAGTGLGAVAGGVLGAVLGNQVGSGNGRAAMTVIGAGGGAYMGNEVEKNTRRATSYQVRVRLDNGKIRTLYQHSTPEVSVGDRVRIVHGIAKLAG